MDGGHGRGYQEGPKRLTNGSDDRGCKNHCVGPVPVVEGLIPRNGHTLSCSIRYYLEGETQSDDFFPVTAAGATPYEHSY